MSVQGLTQSAEAVAEEVVEQIEGQEVPQENEDLKKFESERSEFQKQKDEFASKFAALSRKEKMIRDRESKYEQRLAELEARLKKADMADSLERTILENPLAFLEEKGVTFDNLAEIKINDGKPTPDMQIQRLEQKMNSLLEEKISALEKSYLEDREAQENARIEQTINDFKGNISDFIDQNAEKYELIKQENNIEAVYQVIEQHYSNTSEYDEEGALVQPGTVLTFEQAADLVEQELENQVRKYLAVKKFQAKRDEGLEAKTAVNPAQTKQGGQPVTLSNDQSTKLPTNGNEKLSRDESLRRAASLLRFDA